MIPSAASATKSQLDAITTPHIILMEAGSGSVLYEKAAYSRAYPASTTKIMTCIVALETCSDLDRQYQCGYEAENGFYSQSSLLGLKHGYIVTIRDMLYGLMLCSGNDCGACLAVATCGSMEGFVELMNRKAQDIGMTETHYTNAHGLHNDEHYTTAYDMALLMRYALGNQTFREIIRTLEYTVVEANGKFTKTIQTSNKLLFTKPDIDWEDNIYQYAIGGKTGETNIAGYCLVEAAEKDGVTLITVLFGDPNNYVTSPYYRFHNAKLLFEYGFAQYVSYDMAHFNVPYSFNVQSTGFDPDDPANGVVTAEVDISELEIKGALSDLSGITDQSFSWEEPELDPDAVKAPISIGDKLGTATLLCNGQPFYTGDLIATTAVGSDQKGNNGKQSDIIKDNSSGSRDVCNLTVSKNGGDAEYTVWVYYKNTMFTMKELKWHYLFCDGEVFRSARVPGVTYDLMLYKRVTDEDGSVSYVYSENAEAGESYVIVSQGRALQAVKKGRSLAAVPVVTDEQGNITSQVADNMVWTFYENGTGYQLISNGLYLHRSDGDGLLFWILIGVLAIALIIVIRLLATSRSRRRNPRRRGKYKIYRM
ncbi:MAG: D-alanyl-D-alanine carboxypeptidase [Clostridia bacterium]|nr:D-alanyl-D-alanine carboxypeptidase [Clostridia bacterium]